MASTGGYIGNYRVITQLSSDSFSSVYLAERTQASGAPVTITVWHTIRFDSEQKKSAFLQDVQSLAKLRHPYLLSVIDFGIEGDVPYVVTDYVWSGSLRYRINRQASSPFPLQEALTILAQVGQALHYAHQQNVVHRQLKPEHIFFNAKGEALLADFGLQARLAAPLTADNPGSDPYMAPEQLQGVTTKLSNQYALGAIAYELLTGRQPAENPVPPAMANPALPPDISQALGKAMANQPIDRFANVEAFLSALLANMSSDALTFAASSVVPPHEPTVVASAPLAGGAGQSGPYERFATPPPLVPGPEAAAFSSTGTMANPASGSGVSSGTPGSGLKTGSAWRGKLPRRWRTLALIALIVVLLAGGLPFLLIYLSNTLPASAATVTITPASRHLKQVYTVYALPGTLNNLQSQVQARLLSYTTPAQSKTVNVSGKGHQAATYAKGTVTFSSVSGTIPATSLHVVSNSGVDVTIYVNTPITTGAVVDESAVAQNAGPGGNIGAYDISGSYYLTADPSVTFYIQNNNAFSGGQDAFDYTYVQQSDIDSVATPLASSLTPQAQTGLQNQVHSNEKLASPMQCAPKTSPNHGVNDRVSNVTVSVTVTCTAEAYVPQDVQSKAAELHKSDASTQLGGDYALSGDVLTSAPVVQGVDTNGMITFNVNTEAIWVFQFSDAQKQQLAQLIAGKSQPDTTTLLLKQRGVNKVTLATSGGFGHALPSSSTDIHVTIANVAGLHA